jgi:uncharacterized membrane protein YidH (DUF202 family)
MTTQPSSSSDKDARPERIQLPTIPDLPDVTGMSDGTASTTYSRFRSGLSKLRTGLSEHRTDLSEYRTDLSTDRTDMSMRRTGMSFQRTRMSADRTLMSVIRTSLSLIGFGFTIFQFFEKLKEAGTLQHAGAPRNFGVTLVALGILMLVIGIVYHVQFMLGLRQERTAMKEAGLVYGESKFPYSFTLLTAIVLLGIGIAAISSMVFGTGPFD